MTHNEPIKPKKIGIITISLVLGFLLSLFVALFLALQSRKDG